MEAAADEQARADAPAWYHAADPYERRAATDFLLHYETSYTYDRYGVLGQLTQEEKNRLLVGRELYFKHLDPHRQSSPEDPQDPDGPGRKKEPGRMTAADKQAAQDFVAQKKNQT